MSFPRGESDLRGLRALVSFSRGDSDLWGLRALVSFHREERDLRGLRVLLCLFLAGKSQVFCVFASGGQ